MKNEVEILKKRTQAQALATLNEYTDAQTGITTFEDGTEYINCRVGAVYNGFMIFGEPVECAND